MSRLLQTLLAVAALTVILIGLLVGWAAFGARIFSGREVSDVVNVDPQADELVETLRLSNLVHVNGGPLLRAELTAEQTYDQRSYSKTSSGNVQNLGWLAPGAAPRWLFPARGQLILWQMPLLDQASPAGEVALLLALATADTNGDKRLSAQDAISLEIVTPDGLRRATLAEGLSDFPETSWNGRELALLTRRGEAAELLRVDPASLAVTSTTPVPFP